MLTAYVVSALIGLVLVIASALGGHQGGDTEFHAGAEMDAGQDIHGGADGWDAWMPFLSLRFWSYAAAAFGSIGAIGTAWSGMSAQTVLLAAIMGGLVAGCAVFLLLKLARQGEASSSAGASDLMGKEARMLVGFGEGQPGKVRLQVKGETIDMLAFSDSGAPIPAGEDVIVLNVEGNRLRVARRDEIFPAE